MASKLQAFTLKGNKMPVDGIGYGSITPLAPKQQPQSSDKVEELAPKAEEPAVEINSATTDGSIDIRV